MAKKISSLEIDTQRFSLRIETELYNDLETIGEKDKLDRSINYLINEAVREFINNKKLSHSKWFIKE